MFINFVQTGQLDQALRNAIRWQVARTEEKYLRCQGNACRDYTTEGFKPLSSSIFIPMLDEVFVPLELSSSFLRGSEGESLPMPPGFKWEKEITELLSQQDGLSIWDLLKRAREIPAYKYLCKINFHRWAAGEQGETHP